MRGKIQQLAHLPFFARLARALDMFESPNEPTFDPDLPQQQLLPQ